MRILGQTLHEKTFFLPFFVFAPTILPYFSKSGRRQPPDLNLGLYLSYFELISSFLIFSYFVKYAIPQNTNTALQEHKSIKKAYNRRAEWRIAKVYFSINFREKKKISFFY